jgi:recombinational DNA repair protein RecR
MWGIMMQPKRRVKMQDFAYLLVAEPTNIAAIETTKHFNGVYHVLHGSISPLHGVGPEQLRIANLISRVDAGNVDEVIVATNPTVEGERPLLICRINSSARA